MGSWEELWDWLASYLAQDMTRRIIILDELPRNATGKVLKYQIRENLKGKF